MKINVVNEMYTESESCTGNGAEAGKKGISEMRLNPSFWRTVRLLKNINRLNIIRYLAVAGKSSREAIVRSVGITKKNFEHHFAKIKRAGIVERESAGPRNYHYAIAPQTNPIARTLLAAAANERDK